LRKRHRNPFFPADHLSHREREGPDRGAVGRVRGYTVGESREDRRNSTVLTIGGA
jgi:hypothetical protein